MGEKGSQESLQEWSCWNTSKHQQEQCKSTFSADVECQKTFLFQAIGLTGVTFKCQNIEKWSPIEPSGVNQKDTLQETALCSREEVRAFSVQPFIRIMLLVLIQVIIGIRTRTTTKQASTQLSIGINDFAVQCTVFSGPSMIATCQ